MIELLLRAVNLSEKHIILFNAFGIAMLVIPLGWQNPVSDIHLLLFITF